MNLRKVEMADHSFVLECYADWPLTSRGPATPDAVTRWIRKWMFRSEETAYIAEDGRRIGVITFRRKGNRVKVMNLVVHPLERGKGYSNQIVKSLRDELVEDGVVEAVFDAMEGPIARHVRDGKYLYLGQKQGETGILEVGCLTKEMSL